MEERKALYRGLVTAGVSYLLEDFVDRELCYVPATVTHNYLTARDHGPDKQWFHPYIEEALAEYMSSGHPVDIVRRGSVNECFVSPHELQGNSLTVLPSYQRTDGYMLSGRWSPVQYSGQVWVRIKDSSWCWLSRRSYNYQQRNVEVLKTVHHYLLLVTRENPDSNIENVYLLGWFANFRG
jgi:hypothetical protein